MTKFEKLAKVLSQPKAPTKKWNPSDYFGYSAGFDHSGNPAPSSPNPNPTHNFAKNDQQQDAMVKAMNISHSQAKAAPTPEDLNWFKNDRSQELMKLLGLETTPEGSPILGDSDDKLVESGKGYLDPNPDVRNRSELLERLLIGDDFADTYYKKP